MKQGRTIGALKGVIVRGGDGKPDRVLEEHIIEKNKKELIFMSEERKQELKSRRQFSKYIKQFDKIPRGLK